MFIIGIMAALVTGVVWVARVGLVNATMELLADSAQMSRAIESEISEGSRLEVQYAFATSPAAIQEAASTQLGMVPDQQVEYLRVTPRD
ncbi:MAG: hypothetical protein LBH56_01965 [Coriobacteriales bacterium]|nr:hypothetical protein [Coriobacteriales bacterium]